MKRILFLALLAFVTFTARVHCNNRDDINFQGRLSMEK